MENYSVQVPPYTVGPEAYRQIEKQCHIYGKKAVGIILNILQVLTVKECILLLQL